MNAPGHVTALAAGPPSFPSDGGWGRSSAAGKPAIHQRDVVADDATLIELSRSEPEAFAPIFDRHVSQIRRFAARRLGTDLAEDVVGEVFLVAFRRRDSYDLTHADAGPWLYGIATNVIHRYRHAERRAYQALARTGADPADASATDDVLARVAAGARRRQLAAALAGLSAADRDTLLLAVWGGLSYAETARALRVPDGTVRSRLNRARRKLRDALGITSEEEVQS